jgi:hypothetical protein
MPSFVRSCPCVRGGRRRRGGMPKQNSTSRPPLGRRCLVADASPPNARVLRAASRRGRSLAPWAIKSMGGHARTGARKKAPHGGGPRASDGPQITVARRAPIAFDDPTAAFGRTTKGSDGSTRSLCEQTRRTRVKTTPTPGKTSPTLGKTSSTHETTSPTPEETSSTHETTSPTLEKTSPTPESTSPIRRTR